MVKAGNKFLHMVYKKFSNFENLHILQKLTCEDLIPKQATTTTPTKVSIYHMTAIAYTSFQLSSFQVVSYYSFPNTPITIHGRVSFRGVGRELPPLAEKFPTKYTYVL